MAVTETPSKLIQSDNTTAHGVTKGAPAPTVGSANTKSNLAGSKLLASILKVEDMLVQRFLKQNPESICQCQDGSYFPPTTGRHAAANAASNSAHNGAKGMPVTRTPAFRLLLLPYHFEIGELSFALPYSVHNVRFLQAVESGRLPEDQLNSLPGLRELCLPHIIDGVLLLEVQDDRIVEGRLERNIMSGHARQVLVALEGETPLRQLASIEKAETLRSKRPWTEALKLQVEELLVFAAAPPPCLLASPIVGRLCNVLQYNKYKLNLPELRALGIPRFTPLQLTKPRYPEGCTCPAQTRPSCAPMKAPSAGRRGKAADPKRQRQANSSGPQQQQQSPLSQMPLPPQGAVEPQMPPQMPPVKRQATGNNRGRGVEADKVRQSIVDDRVSSQQGYSCEAARARLLSAPAEAAVPETIETVSEEPPPKPSGKAQSAKARESKAARAKAERNEAKQLGLAPLAPSPRFYNPSKAGGNAASMPGTAPMAMAASRDPGCSSAVFPQMDAEQAPWGDGLGGAAHPPAPSAAEKIPQILQFYLGQSRLVENALRLANIAMEPLNNTAAELRGLGTRVRPDANFVPNVDLMPEDLISSGEIAAIAKREREEEEPAARLRRGKVLQEPNARLGGSTPSARSPTSQRQVADDPRRRLFKTPGNACSALSRTWGQPTPKPLKREGSEPAARTSPNTQTAPQQLLSPRNAYPPNAKKAGGAAGHQKLGAADAMCNCARPTSNTARGMPASLG